MLHFRGFHLVSTHSRLKAAGWPPNGIEAVEQSFNTQPPEGGWRQTVPSFHYRSGFNTQPPEGGWDRKFQAILPLRGFNTQPPEGGWINLR